MNYPRKLISMFVIMVAFACSGGDAMGPPTSGTLAVGTYTYSASIPFVLSDGSLRQAQYAGTLTLMYVASDSIAGTWAVQQSVAGGHGYEPQARLGFWNADAYVLYARLTSGSSIAHRIGRNLSCTAKFVGPDPTGSCTLAKQ